jgi:hypothetical protein
VKRAAPYTPLLVAAACVAVLVPLQRWVDARGFSREPEEEALYFSRPETAKRMALGYDSLLADVYWMRAIQYFGRKVIDDPGVIEGRTDRLSLLYPLLDTATTLDPHEIAPYRFGGFFVHDYVDAELGRALLEKGIRANPDYLPLYQDLAYLYWSDGDCATASKVYATAASVPGAPPWMAEMSALILARCGRADLTAELLELQYQSTDDPRVRERLAELLVPYRALAEVAYLRQAAAAYRERFGAPPSSLADLVRALGRQQGAPALTLRPDGTPVDPTGVPYVYDPATGAVSTAPNGVALPNLGPR